MLRTNAGNLSLVVGQSRRHSNSLWHFEWESSRRCHWREGANYCQWGYGVIVL